jgi:arylsulfate sulfotransferase
MAISSGRHMPRLRALLVALTVSFGAAHMEGAIGVTLVASPPSPAPVGTMIAWSAQVSDAASNDLWYRFRVVDLDGDSRMIRDYGPLSALDWTAIEQGTYVLEVSVRDRATGEAATALSVFQLDSRVQGDEAVVTPTSHPLVFLFSAPGCAAGRARVKFQSSESFVQYTPYKSCLPERSLNFYLAGLVPNAPYAASLIVEQGRDRTYGSAGAFQTGDVPSNLPVPSVLQAAANPDLQRVLMQAPLFAPAIATDLRGRLLWFGPSDLSYLTRPAAGGTFFGLFQSGIDTEHDVVRRFDLVGTTVQETNVARINEQLAALGKRPISGFHHEARVLNDGKTLVLADVEQILTDVQGPGPVDVIGDMILVLDADLKVVWTWDAFDHLDPTRAAVLGETCLPSPGCAPHYLDADAHDWTHGNSVSDTPDGGLLYSARHQDWLIKIDYRKGTGNGDVIWRLGKDGDFTYDSTDPYPSFSHQHDAGYEFGSRSRIALFDNGNTRFRLFPGQSSRGQAIELDEKARTVRLVFNVDLGVVSPALGSAQKLVDGTYHFDAGLISGATAVSIQIDPSGNQIISSISLPTPVYRSFRIDDLYGQERGPTRPGTGVVVPREAPARAARTDD